MAVAFPRPGCCRHLWDELADGSSPKTTKTPLNLTLKKVLIGGTIKHIILMLVFTTYTKIFSQFKIFINKYIQNHKDIIYKIMLTQPQKQSISSSLEASWPFTITSPSTLLPQRLIQFRLVHFFASFN